MSGLINLFENSPFVVFECEKKDKWSIISVTGNVEDLIGYTNKEIMKESHRFFELLTTNECENSKNKILENINNKVDDFNVELCKFKKKNNESIWLEAYVHIKRNEEGKVEKAFAYLIDITKHKKTEVELEESKEKYRIISESTLDGIFILDKTGTMIFANKGMYTLTGRSPEGIIGVHFSKYVPLSELPKYLLKLKNILLKQEVKSFVSKIIHNDGHLVDVEINGKLVKQNGHWVAQGSMRNITNRKEMIRNLKDSEERLRVIFENNPVPTFFGDFSFLESI